MLDDFNVSFKTTRPLELLEIKKSAGSFNIAVIITIIIILKNVCLSAQCLRFLMFHF